MKFEELSCIMVEQSNSSNLTNKGVFETGVVTSVGNEWRDIIVGTVLRLAGD